MAKKPKKDYTDFPLIGAATFIPIVGAHFRPPAQSVLNALNMGEELVLRREPSNPYDANAIQVLVRNLTSDHVHEAVAQTIKDWEQLNGTEYLHWDKNEFHIGYVPAPLAARLAPRMDSEGEASFAEGGSLFVDWVGSFSHAADGEPCITGVAEAVA